jgi:2',3'-cyclic-nucleotide 2'-phosphodiesterase (5'-nucleotidase family)
MLSSRRAMLGAGAAGLATLLFRPARAQVPGAAPGPVEITFLHVNDIYEHAPTDGWGGLAELATLIEAERARAPGPVVFTFGGDLISPSLASGETKGRHMIELFNALGPDAAVLGNHEFDFGPEVAAERIGESRFPWLGANVKVADGRIFGGAQAGLLRQVAPGITLGIAGVLTRQTAALAPAEGVTFEPEVPALRAALADLRGRGATLLVALTHLDLAEDRAIAGSLDGISLILGGHDHDPAGILEHGVLVMRAGSNAHWLAKAVLRVAPPARPGELAGSMPAFWGFVPNYRTAPSPRLAPIVARIEDQLARTMAEPLLTLAAPLDSRTATLRTREAAIGNLVADALRAHFRADAALMNGGGLRGDREYPAGHVLTRQDLAREMPFGNAVVLLELSGADLRQALEQGLAEVEKGAGRFPQVSGVTLSYDPTAPAGQRIRDLAVGGRPVEDGRRYTLATTDYLAGGRDGYTLLKDARVRVDASGGPLLVNVVADALRQAGAKVPEVEGRVVAR